MTTLKNSGPPLLGYVAVCQTRRAYVHDRRALGYSFLAVILSLAFAFAQAPSNPPVPAGNNPLALGRGQAPAPGPGGRGGGRGPAQGGTGQLKVLFVSKGHPFDREGLFSTLDALGTEITWTHLEQPAAELYLDPKNAPRMTCFCSTTSMGRSRIGGTM